jgi:hypothetical protein
MYDLSAVRKIIIYSYILDEVPLCADGLDIGEREREKERERAEELWLYGVR